MTRPCVFALRTLSFHLFVYLAPRFACRFVAFLFIPRMKIVLLLAFFFHPSPSKFLQVQITIVLYHFFFLDSFEHSLQVLAKISVPIVAFSLPTYTLKA
jgi:hypothetical protein